MEAVFGLLGVIVGSFIPWFKESLSQKQLRTEEGAYLAVRVICILEEYTSKCVEVVQDDGTVLGKAATRDENGFDLYIPQVPPPPFPPFPEDVNWKSIDSKLMYRILSFPNVVRTIDDSISFVATDIASPPDYAELFEARFEGYAKLGLEAINLIEELRVAYNLPEKENPHWSPKRYLEEKKRNIEDIKRKRAAAFEAAFSPLANLTDK